jgi:predicted phosphate transport protein (TIGR00153 family)
VLSLLFKKEHRLETLFFSYLENLAKTEAHFLEAITLCLEKGQCEAFSFLIEQTHKYESKADDIRDEINELMYSRALIPELREDIMSLLERVDEIPGTMEMILNIIHIQKLNMPDFLALEAKDLVRISMESCHLLGRQIEVMFKKKEGVRSLMATIDQNESHCDHIEQRMMTRLFESDLEPFLKLQLKELIIAMGEISDQADRVSKRVNILTMKRRV